jgi:hypothetical protein
MLVCAQVKIVAFVLFVIDAIGGVMFWVIVILLVAVQPFAPVTVTVYTPGWVNVLAAVVGVFPPLH